MWDGAQPTPDDARAYIEEGGRRRSEEVQQKKQEPHTTMWGKTIGILW